MIGKNQKALQRREIIDELSESYVLESVENIVFNIKSIQPYIKMFKKLQDEEIIVKGDFKDSLWTMLNVEGKSYFNFNLNINNDIILALKCFVVQKRHSGINTQTVRSNLNSIISALEISNALDKKAFQQFEETINTFGPAKRYDFATSVKEFLLFYPHLNAGTYYDICLKFSDKVSNVRKLPNYQDILLFDSVLEKYALTSFEKSERLRFFPIILWWKITCIIPMRPTEFYSLKRNCIIKDQDDKYWLTLPRKKQVKRIVGKLEITDIVQINQEVYDLINEYKDLTTYFSVESPYLISYSAYRRYVKLKVNEKARNKMAAYQFITLIDHFYQEVVIDIFGYPHLEKIKPGDTRHFAFCNMMLQGFNMLTIARIGGHAQIESQLHYHRHLDHFVDSYVYQSANNILNDRFNQSFIQNEDLNKTINKSRIYELSEFENKYEVEYGYCTYTPADCKAGDCRFCNHFYFYPENFEDGVKWLRDTSLSMEIRIKEQLELMKHITKNMNYDTESLQYQPTGQERLFSIANGLRRMMDQKAMVDSHLLEDV